MDILETDPKAGPAVTWGGPSAGHRPDQQAAILDRSGNFQQFRKPLELRNMALASLIAFGPQTSAPSIEYLSRLRANLLNDSRLHTFLSAINELPKTWQTLVESNSDLRNVPGLQSISDIQRWVDQGESAWTTKVLPNVLLTPLTVIIHIVEYFQYLDSEEGDATHSQVLEGVLSGGIQGFCTGLLAVVALACSKDEEGVNVLGAVALRLAMCIGAFVDLDGAFASTPHETCCLAVRWRPEAGRDPVRAILRGYPDAYVSVITDSTSVTITVSKSTAISITNELSSQGFTVKPINLEGRFHSSIHEKVMEQINELCASNHEFQFPSAEALLVPVRSNSNAQIIARGSLHQIVIKSILIEPSNWHLTISAAASQLAGIGSISVVTVGLVDCVPSSILREECLKITKSSGFRVFSRESLDVKSTKSSSSNRIPRTLNASDYRYPDHAIAVVGMGCRFPGADSINEFWQLIQSGASMVQELPAERFSTQGLRRTPDLKTRFWGNFVSDIDAFDHRFFKKSSREAASMDPQQRLLYHVAYEAMESSGYFGVLSKPAEDDIGCYIGVGATDYNDNVASHPPTAFSALGTLRAFLSGKISHFFGWTGPSITYDTACSSSAVAIHAACKAIQSGECSRALAGGVNLITSPNLFQNLMAASFLSPTGASKSFDAKADGYCRGEGIGLVVLEKLSRAVANGDTILGVIAGSAINQNSNSSSITVPHSESQIKLYQKVSHLAGLHPDHISFVEAHGTGTPVGDPIECRSIRHVFGGPQRAETLYLGSVKGNIGHTEGTSGAAALIKTILMLQHEAIPMQASFVTLNPKIAPLAPDQMEIPLGTRKWDSEFRAACINNYGAAGSNAAMIVCQPPLITQMSNITYLSRYPIFLTANSATSLARYCTSLQEQLVQLSSKYSENILLANFTFNLAEKHNRSLPHTLITTVTSLSDLKGQLTGVASKSEPFAAPVAAKAKPVVLVFSGQAGRTINLNGDIYHGSTLFRSHLDHCDRILRSAGCEGLFPEIFSAEPVEDIVKLHCMLFSFQYASAKSWLDSGLLVETVIGHSFGQLTALCVSGCLSLEHGLKLVTGRARLIQKHWSEERGSMIHLQADIHTVSKILSSLTPRSEYRVEIACYNGPTSHVVVGSEPAIEAVEIAAKQFSFRGPVKTKILDITHGYHSRFTDPLLPGLTELAEQLVFNEPTISLETCSDGQSWTKVEPQLIAEHTRTPVYFKQAVERIVNRLGPCTWLEVGVGPPVTNMVRHALGTSTSSPHMFQPSQLSIPEAMSSLADTTSNLWKVGHKVQFWPFHPSQKYEYSSINLPPYQFEKPRHWLTYMDTIEAPSSAALAKVESEPCLVSAIKSDGQSQSDAEFSIDPRSEQFKLLVVGHAVLANPLCPVALYVEIVSIAAKTIAFKASSTHVPSIEELEIKAPLGLDPDRVITLSLNKVQGFNLTWTFSLSSRARNHELSKAANSTQHATGRVRLELGDEPVHHANFARFERLINHGRCDALMADPDAEAMQGSLIYKVFAKAVQYADYYRGVKSISSKDHEVAGHVTLAPCNLKPLDDTASDPLAIDSFLQVAGLHVNSLNDCGDNEIFVATKLEAIQPSSKFKQTGVEPRSWMVYANFAESCDKEVVNDIYVFDSRSKSLVMIILGAHFTKVQISSLARVLSRANPAQGPAIESPRYKPGTVPPVESTAAAVARQTSTAKVKDGHQMSTSGERTSEYLQIAVHELLSKVADISRDMFNNQSTFKELGIDSLMVTEVLSEIRQTFNVDIPLLDFQGLKDVKSLCDYLHSKTSSPLEMDSTSATPYSYTESDSSTATLATPVSGELKEPSDNVLSQLVKLVAEHLETNDISQDTCLGDAGLDSLVSIELLSDIEKWFRVQVDSARITAETTFGDLCNMVLSHQKPAGSAVLSMDKPGSFSPNTTLPNTVVSSIESPRPSSDTSGEGTLPSFHLAHAQKAFGEIRLGYDLFAEQTGFANFWIQVYPKQLQLVVAYIVEAFESLGCSLRSLGPDERLPPVHALPNHKKVMSQFYKILQEASLIKLSDHGMVRSDVPIDSTPSDTLHQDLLRTFPQHAFEHRLLHITGSRLAECLSGRTDPLQLMFRRKEDRDLMEDVYTNAPMFAAGTRLLGSFLSKAFTNRNGEGTFHILELGGGTAGTTKYIVDHLVRQNIKFTYTFTDISASLVAGARKKFPNCDFMEFAVLDVEKSPPEQFLNRYHTIISTNCIHATKNLTHSLTNMRKMLLADGFVTLVELTKNIFWFDLVFGLLEGWWLFEDGRSHALADVSFWEKSMKEAQFKHIAWSGSNTPESCTLRIITAFLLEPEDTSSKPKSSIGARGSTVETVMFKQTGGTPLYADIYLPTASQVMETKRPVALMIHGGGHIMLSRKDIRSKQTQLLLDNGLLPVSIDYRLCPELNLLQGAMVDVCDALQWARHELPSLNLSRSGLQIDGERVVVVGWSTGGHLAMTLAWTAEEKNVRPPEATLAFYCPTDYEADCWIRPNFPASSEAFAGEEYDLFEGVQDNPITAYNVPAGKSALGGWMSLSDPRSRIALHMNWKGQALPILLGGLPSKGRVVDADAERWLSLDQPAHEQIVSISPYAQVVRGNYRTPTFLIHGTEDDLIPWQQTQKVYEALISQGIPAGVAILEGAPHLFDLYRDGDGKGWQVIREGYQFLFSHLFSN